MFFFVDLLLQLAQQVVGVAGHGLQVVVLSAVNAQAEIFPFLTVFFGLVVLVVKIVVELRLLVRLNNLFANVVFLHVVGI